MKHTDHHQVQIAPREIAPHEDTGDLYKKAIEMGQIVAERTERFAASAERMHSAQGAYEVSVKEWDAERRSLADAREGWRAALEAVDNAYTEA